MPEYLRALVVILFLATVVFAFAKKPACAVATTPGDFERRRNLWFGITFAAFLAHNFWIFIAFAGAMLLFALPREQNKLAMFYFLLFAVPMFPAKITGLGIINHFFTIDYVRLLALTVLLPTFLRLRKQPDVEPFGRSLPDKLLAGYLILQFALMLSAGTFTNVLRIGAFYAFLDVFLPYYVASRSLKSLPAFRDALMAFAMSALVLAAIGAFEYARHWLLYQNLEDALGAERWGYGGYLERGQGALRASGSVGQPIVLGYVMAVAAAFFIYLRKSIPSATAWGFGMAALMVGLIAPLSRGPWMGAAAILMLFIATGPFPVKGFVKLGLLGLTIIPVLLVTSTGQEIIDHLPFIGTVDSENVVYRQRLLEITMQIVMDHPFFGAFDFIYSSAMQELKQGEGIIDLVNTYVGIGLGSGLVGLSLFAGFFIAVAAGIFKSMKSFPDRNSELYLLGQSLFSVLLGILITIFTVSSITVIPVIYWSVAGLGVAYARMIAIATVPSNEFEAKKPTRFQPAYRRENIEW